MLELKGRFMTVYMYHLKNSGKITPNIALILSDKSENKIFEDVQIFTYFVINCQMRFIDIFKPDFTDDSNETGKQ